MSLRLPFAALRSLYPFSPPRRKFSTTHNLVGELLHDHRYRIVHKLGFGGYSTVWLARDEVAGRYVAIRILTANGDSNESNILRRLDFIHDAHPGRTVLRPTLDQFVVKGPNGKH
ncbi:hypothetical protein AJ80_05123 [Polytolypa hystricis UAMH7299]|uniref:Protein kinase domain-containing protein n=1 Tax=Polytolypa hystricis (strain UAMH7299) TaxID=1447883 RepID=A0A2B7Y6I3_POLH7|nr:hypothetical protein AJ80_05123 [Polytolypa hystricis UAMH7299]